MPTVILSEAKDPEQCLLAVMLLDSSPATAGSE